MSNYLLFLSVYALLLVDEKTGYPVGGSDRRLRAGAGPRPRGCGLAGAGEASSLPSEGHVPLLALHLPRRSRLPETANRPPGPTSGVEGEAGLRRPGPRPVHPQLV